MAESRFSFLLTTTRRAPDRKKVQRIRRDDLKKRDSHTARDKVQAYKHMLMPLSNALALSITEVHPARDFGYTARGYVTRSIMRGGGWLSDASIFEFFRVARFSSFSFFALPPFITFITFTTFALMHLTEKNVRFRDYD